MKVFISQPMRYLTLSDIEKEQNLVLNSLEKYFNDIELIQQFFDKDLNYSPITCLAESLKLMESADIIVFHGDWNRARGCCIEHSVAMKYGLDNVYYSIETEEGIQIVKRIQKQEE